MNLHCGVCGKETEDGYGECEECGKILCSEHNNLEKGICPECKGTKEQGYGNN